MSTAATRTSSPLARSAGLTGAATLTSRILGLARETVLAAVFGAGNEMDAFFVAFRIPNLVRALFAEGAMSAAFIPTFTQQLAVHGKTAAWRLGNNIVNVLAVTTGVLVVGGIVFAPPIVAAYAGRFSEVPGKLELTVELTRIMLPFLTMVAVAAAVMGMLNSLHHYFVPSLSPAMFNIATIAAAVFLVPVMPRLGYPRIVAIAVAALAGGMLQVALQWPALRREGFRYRPALDLRDPATHQVLLLMGPGTIGLAATQVNIFVNTLLATSQGPGAVSWLTYAFRLIYLPIGLFGVSIGTAVLPMVSRHAAVGDDAAVRRTVAQGLGMMLAMNVPATVGLWLLAHPIVALLFQRGRFEAADTAATAAAVQWFAIGLVGYAAVRVLTPVFYAMRQSRAPVAVSVFTMIVNVALSVALVRVMGIRGLALGTSLAAAINGAALVWLLRRRLNGIEGRYLVGVLGKLIIASAAMAAVTLAAGRLTALISGAGTAGQAVRLTVTIAAGMATLGVSAKLLRIREIDEIRALLRVRKLLTGG